MSTWAKIAFWGFLVPMFVLASISAIYLVDQEANANVPPAMELDMSAVPSERRSEAEVAARTLFEYCSDLVTFRSKFETINVSVPDKYIVPSTFYHLDYGWNDWIAITATTKTDAVFPRDWRIIGLEVLGYAVGPDGIVAGKDKAARFCGAKSGLIPFD